MQFGKKTALSAVLAVAAVVGSVATVSAQQLKSDEIKEVRAGLMLATKVQAGPLLGYAQGKADLPADAAVRAENLVALARMAPFAWAKGTESVKSETKPEAFTSADFAKGWDAFGAASAKLAEAAKANDAAAIKTQAAALGKVCHDCHEAFKKD